MIIIVGAVVVALMTGDIALALFPLVVGILCVFVADGGWHLSRPDLKLPVLQ